MDLKFGGKNNDTCLIALTIIKTIHMTNTIIPIIIRIFPMQLLKEYEYLIMQSYDSNEALHF